MKSRLWGLLLLALTLAAALGGSSNARAAGVSIRPVCSAVPAGYARWFSVVAVNALPLAGNPSGYGPADLQSAYALPSSTAGSGQTVGIVDAFDDPTAEQDLAQYRSFYGLPPCTTANGCFRKVNQTGGTLPMPPPSPDWALEISLDLDMVSAVCPNCHILLVESNTNLDSDLYTAEDTAARLGANAISNSWGGSEYSGETADDSHFNHPGAAITASVYALAGNAGSVNAGSYPYSHTSGLFDVTTGSNGSCNPAYLCNGQAGYDGPTGLGTPNGTSGF